MKISKLYSKITACVLSFGLLSSGGVIYAAEGQDLPDTVPSQLMEELDPNAFSGIYKDGSEYIIQSADVAATQRSVARRRDVATLNIEYNDVQYSLKDLREARDKLVPFMEELKMVVVGLDIINNAVSVASMDLSEENKARIRELSGIENIVFRAGTEIYRELPNESENASPTLDESTRAAVPVYAGFWTGHTTTPRFSSIATSVRSTSSADSSKGFITCGHGWNQGQSAFLFDDDKSLGSLGTVKRLSVSEFCDAAYISSTQKRTGQTYDEKRISYQGNPIPGDTVYIIGARSRSEKIYVQVSKVISIEEIITPKGGKVTHTNAFSFESKGLTGDSGCALLTEYAGEYAISGVQTAHMQTAGGLGEGFGIKWNDIKRTLNITAVSS